MLKGQNEKKLGDKIKKLKGQTEGTRSETAKETS